MTTLKVYYQLFVCFTIALGASHCYFPLFAADHHFSEENNKSTPLFGRLANGMCYTIVPSDNCGSGIWIKLTCTVTGIEKKSLVPALMQHVPFYGTEHYPRQAIAKKLNELGLDTDADSYVHPTLEAQSLQLSLSTAAPSETQEVLALLNQMMFHPTLKHEDIEMARTHLAQSCTTESDLLSLRGITAAELKAFHSEWYQPKNMHVTLVGVKDAREFLPLLASSFASEVASTHTLPSKPRLTENLVEKIEWVTDDQCYAIDGKIWMKEANWINKSSNGRTLGALLTVLGIGGMIVAFPFTFTATIIAGGLSTGTGIYYATADYLKDPHYIESSRRTDLQYGCAYAYMKGRVGLTLTPYERRALFLQEMVDYPHKLSKQPIVVLADIYQLNDPVIAEIFTVDEFNALSTLKRNFIQQRNLNKHAKESLDQELAAVTAPHSIAKDASMARVKEFYSQNYYVVARESYKLQRDATIAEIEKAYTDSDISLDEKEAQIKQAHAYFESAIRSPDFQAGLNAADLYLAQAELEIQTNYGYHVEAAKQSIQYNQRMAYYHQGEQSLITYFNQELHNLLGSFPVYATIFPDTLDLRNL